MGEITKEKARIYLMLHTMIIKTLLVLVGLGSFLWVLYFLIHAETAFDLSKFGSLDVLIGYSTLRVYKYYFKLPEDKKK